ncbi:ParA family protein [Ohtaekwangia koreensis]|uniref:Chromosome partitioning protein n=1 Tax=Ohtaekwangia koreensis TaxID=688867 RepID=A0A1T5JSD5_9BACT|nr:AAA family ATPase [Ohtaekwangia koreensis]SKC54273.1 chromosome partitioning protein [Ohtaekwangia koreensis]
MIISIVNHKGGTGKTTTTLNLGAALALKGYRILLVDLDAQGNLSYSLGAADASATLSDVLFEEATLEDALVSCEGMDLLPGNTKLADVELALSKIDNRYFLLRNALQPAVDKYDFILMDCPPSLSLLTVNALCASDSILIPLQLEVLSVRGLDLILNSISKIQGTLHPGLSILGVLPVLVDMRKNLNTEIVSYINTNYKLKIFESYIRSNVKASEAPSFGSSVIQYAPSSTSAQDYIKFSKEFLKAIQLTLK